MALQNKFPKLYLLAFIIRCERNRVYMYGDKMRFTKGLSLKWSFCMNNIF